MPNREGLWSFEVKTTKGWKLLTGLRGESDEDRRAFAQKTADAWEKK